MRLEPGHSIDRHRNDEVDVLIVVVDGDGTLVVDGESRRLTPGLLAHVPRGTSRTITAGPVGLAHLTVHVRRRPLSIGPNRR